MAGRAQMVQVLENVQESRCAGSLCKVLENGSQADGLEVCNSLGKTL